MQIKLNFKNYLTTTMKPLINIVEMQATDWKQISAIHMADKRSPAEF